MAGLYIHIPFCTYKCFYCDFYSGNQLYLIDKYVDSIIMELQLRKHYLNGDKIETIYLGGGTPSLLSGIQLSKILNSIFLNFIVDTNCEITIECNPENVSKVFVDDLIDLGFNRISLGVQFLDDQVLKSYNRNHNKNQILNSLDTISRTNFHNLSVDIIYAVPGIEDDFLLSSLVQLMAFDIKHVSAYSLTIAKNSQLFWKIRKGEFNESNEDYFLSQYRIINNYLKSCGFTQYEISNYAKDGYSSRHNIGYWNQIPYLGIGVSSHSYNGISRQWNHSNIKKYILDLSQKQIISEFEIEELTENQLYNEYVILELRTFQGISIDFVRESFDSSIYKHFNDNLLTILSKKYLKILDGRVIPNDSDLLLSDYLSQILMI